MSLPMLQDVLSTIRTYVETREDRNLTVIYLSGGEPLLHPDFKSILQSCYEQFNRVTILTNGILVKENISLLMPYRDKLCVQVSLDGDEESNDSIRGKSVYKIAVEALQGLQDYGINHWLSYTVSQVNKHCIKDVLQVARQTNSKFNNVTPYTGDTQLMLSYPEWKEFKYNFEKETRRIGWDWAHGPNCCGFTYHCGESHSGLAVNPDGTFAGCARINNVLGYYADVVNLGKRKRQLISQTCMKSKWGDIKDFDFLTGLE